MPTKQRGTLFPSFFLWWPAGLFWKECKNSLLRIEIIPTYILMDLSFSDGHTKSLLRGCNLRFIFSTVLLLESLWFQAQNISSSEHIKELQGIVIFVRTFKFELWASPPRCQIWVWFCWPVFFTIFCFELLYLFGLHLLSCYLVWKTFDLSISRIWS